MILDKVSPPSLDDMKAASGVSKAAAKDWVSYCKSCMKRIRIINDVLKIHLPSPPLESMKALDWGCAAGGVSMLLQEQHPFKVYAADVDSHSLKWIHATSQSMEVAQLYPESKLPFIDEYFHFVVGISVLTHLPHKMQELYASELNRVLDKSGIMLLTVFSYAGIDYNKLNRPKQRLHPTSKHELKEKGIIYDEYVKNTLDSLDFVKSSTYGIAYVSHEYIDIVFGKHFTILEHREAHLGPQDVLILKSK